MSADRVEQWRLYWGPGPLPQGATVLGVTEDRHGTGVLMQLPTGVQVIGSAGALRSVSREYEDRPRNRSLSATDRDWDRLLQVGNGNRSGGLRMLLALWDDTHGAHVSVE